MLFSCLSWGGEQTRLLKSYGDLPVKACLFFPYNGEVKDTWSLFSDRYGDDYILAAGNWGKANGLDTIVFLLTNDDPECRVCFSKGGVYCGAPDTAKINRLISVLKLARENGWNMVPTLFCDYQAGPNRIALNWHLHKAFCEAVCKTLNPYVRAYIIGIESSEYLTVAETERLIGWMKEFTSLPVGVHLQWDLTSPLPRNADFMAYEHSWHPGLGDSMSVADAVEEAREVIYLIGPGRAWFLEYNLNPTGTRIREQSRALHRLPGCVGIGGPL